MDSSEMVEEFLRQNEELTEAKQQIFRLQRENESMKKTIETILRVKCKRGEGAFSLNIDLKQCVSTNLTNIFSDGHYIHYDANRKVTDIVTDLIVSVLVGHTRNDIPCEVLDTNTIVHRGRTNWVASTFVEFSDLMHDMFKQHISQLEPLTETPSDVYISIINTILQDHLFSSCMKRALKLYKDL